MAMSLSEQVTYSTVKINCQYSNGDSGSGTGFIMNLCEDREHGTHIPVIITNNHVVKDCIKTEIEFCTASEEGTPIDTNPVSVHIDGYSWISHPNPSIDLCCMPLAIILDAINKIGKKAFYIALTSDLIADDTFLSELMAMEDVVMIGYPRGLMDTYNHKPIIRKGITATHPRKNYMGKPEILLDIAAYPGSSGSPVFILNEGSYVSGNTVNIGSRIKLLGVLYAGPEVISAGAIVFSTIPVNPIPIIKHPINLGIAIKASLLFEFESYLKSRFKTEA